MLSRFSAILTSFPPVCLVTLVAMYPQSNVNEFTKIIHTCSAAMTLDHLVECRQVAVCNFRYHLKQQLIALIHTVDGSASWLRHHSHVSLVPFLSTLFPSPDGHAWDLLNITRCMIGAFTSVQCRSAIRLLQLRDHKSGLSMFQQFRLVCAEEVSTLFSQWKDSG